MAEERTRSALPRFVMLDGQLVRIICHECRVATLLVDDDDPGSAVERWRVQHQGPAHDVEIEFY